MRQVTTRDSYLFDLLCAHVSVCNKALCTDELDTKRWICATPATLHTKIADSDKKIQKSRKTNRSCTGYRRG